MSEELMSCSSVGESHGRDEFFDAIDAVQARVPPGSVLARSAPIDEHHGRARFCWRFEDPETGMPSDEQPFGVYLRGMDFATLDDDGRLASLTVFGDAVWAERRRARASAPAVVEPGDLGWLGHVRCASSEDRPDAASRGCRHDDR